MRGIQGRTSGIKGQGKGQPSIVALFYPKAAILSKKLIPF